MVNIFCEISAYKILQIIFFTEISGIGFYSYNNYATEIS